MISKRNMEFCFHDADVARRKRCPLEWIGQSKSQLGGGTVLEACPRMRLILPIAVALCAGCGPHTPQQNPEPLRSSPGIPSLSGLDDATRQSIELACMMQKAQGPVAIELACMTQKAQGPVAYGECLRAQLRSIGIQPR